MKITLTLKSRIWFLMIMGLLASGLTSFASGEQASGGSSEQGNAPEPSYAVVLIALCAGAIMGRRRN